MKKNIFNVFILFSVAILISSCNSGSNGYQTSSNKLKYKIIVDNKQPKAKPGEYITYDVTWKTLKDSLIFSSGNMSQPLVSLVARPLFEGDPWEIFSMVGVGDSASVMVPAKIIFKEYVPKNMTPDELMVMNLKVISVMNQHEYDSITIAKLNEQLNRESDLFESYLRENNIKATKTPSGIYVSIEKEGVGKQASVGSIVKVNYNCKSLSGTIYDSSYRPGGSPYELTIGAHSVITGWEEGLKHFNKGAKGKLLVPSELAYGERGNPPAIGPNEPLVFDIEMVDIK